MLAFLAMVLIAFILFILVFLFFYKFKARLPYYQIDQTYCRFLLQHAISEDLPCVDWYLFIGTHNVISEELELLRLACFEIDEQYAKTSKMKNSKPCMQFSLKGKADLSSLLNTLAD